jgi:replication factor C large subunit
MELWTEKHKPKKTGNVVGQKKAILEVQNFLDHWRPGNAMLFHGPPGVGKTMLAEIVAGERDWALVQVNASDSRTGKEIGALLDQSSRQRTLFHTGKIILIDEVDGISGRERGAASSIIKVIKDSRFPIILSANDPWKPKLRPLRQYCTMVKFNRIPYPSIAKRLREITEKEKVKADEGVLKDLARWASGDIRSAVLDLQLLSAGRDAVTDKDLEALGFRERKRTVLDVLPTLFFSGSLNASRKVIREVDKDPDEVFWWLESNLGVAYKDTTSLADGYELLAKADLFRSIVIKQQNWRFKAYMIDMMSGISLFKDDHHGFVPFKPPYRLIRLGQTRQRRALLNSLSKKLGGQLHCSGRVIKREYLPYLRFMLLKGQEMPEEAGLTPEEIETVKKF